MCILSVSSLHSSTVYSTQRLRHKKINQIFSVTADEKQRSKLRSSASNIKRLSTEDGRRHGRYIPSDDSDTELRPEDLKGSGARRPSSAKSDSPKSVSRLSIKSTNTSTETLQDKDSDGDSSPEQRRRSSHTAAITAKNEEAFDPLVNRPASVLGVEGEKHTPRTYSPVLNDTVVN